MKELKKAAIRALMSHCLRECFKEHTIKMCLLQVFSMCVWLGVGVVQDVYMGASTLEIQKRSTGCLGAGVTGACELPDMGADVGAEVRTWVLSKNRLSS